jgi:hypothetical protein
MLVSVLVLVAGCFPFGPDSQKLDEEFSIGIDDTARIKGEKLEITFMEVIEDSRCPEGAPCIWQGRVSVKLQIDYDGEFYDMVLIQYGLYDGYDTETYQEYTFTYKVEPYPESDKGIKSRDYELLMTVSKEE